MQGDGLPQMGQFIRRVVRFARQPGHAEPVFAFPKLGVLPCPVRLISYGMRSQTTFVITAGALCHLFLFCGVVTSQTPPSGGSRAQVAPQSSPCHAVLTAPPLLQKTNGTTSTKT